MATALVTALSSARKAHSLYPAAHPEHRAALDAFVGGVAEVTAAGPFTLNLHLGRLYHESKVLPADAPGMRSVAESFEAHRIESLTFQRDFAEADAIILIEIIGLKPAPDLDVATELEARGAVGVAARRLEAPDEEAAAVREEQRGQDRAMYHRLVSAMKRATAQIGSGGSASFSDTGPIVESVLARFLDDSAAVLGLAMMRDPSEADLFHSINTMIYAITIGVGLEIPPEGLSTLGMCALLHDVGKLAFDRSDPAQQERIKLLHPRIGAEILARVPEIDRAAMLVAYEHHHRPDGTGWPQMEPDYIAHPYSRMVSIADRYDRLTTDAPYGEGMTPDRAVVQLLRETAGSLDLTFTRVFVREMGAFPVGCLVRLSDQSVGVVSAPGFDPLKPRVRLVYGADGLALETKPDTDLAGSELNIVEVVPPADLSESVSDHL